MFQIKLIPQSADKSRSVRLKKHITKFNPNAHQRFCLGDVVYVDFPKSNLEMDHEQCGVRPVIVMRAKDTKDKSGMLFGIKLTRQLDKHSKYNIPIDVSFLDPSSAIINQAGSFSVEKVTTPIQGNVGVEYVQKLKAALKDYLEL